jgi:hypothetical protein
MGIRRPEKHPDDGGAPGPAPRSPATPPKSHKRKVLAIFFVVVVAALIVAYSGG